MCAWQYLLLLSGGVVGLCGLWRTASLSWQNSSVRAKASIEFDLSIPISSSATPHRLLSKKNKGPAERVYRKYQGTVSKYMHELYRRKPDADIIRALAPVHVSVPGKDAGRILVFSVPPVDTDEILQAAELLGTAGTILRVRSFSDGKSNAEEGSSSKSRREASWRAFDVSSVVAGRSGNLVKVYVYGRVGYRPCGDGPILLLSYSKGTTRLARRARRSSTGQEAQEEKEGMRWEEAEEEEEAPRRRRRNSCRRRPLYVDFSLIAYDEWVVAPPGYEAYQCAGKCFYPFGEHLSPTKHAIVQTLIHGALQGIGGVSGSKPVGRACCVPTRLAPTSLLYVDGSGTLTYQYGYEDMVVLECGCR